VAPVEGKLPALCKISLFLGYALSRLEDKVQCFSLKGFSIKDPAGLKALSGKQVKHISASNGYNYSKQMIPSIKPRNQSSL
jgi:hypothetical protein